jgi:hypothetical protein
MPNGKPGDHPFTDILHYGHSEYGEPVDSMVKHLAKHPRFGVFRESVASLLWKHSPMGRPEEREALISQCTAALHDIQTRVEEGS